MLLKMGAASAAAGLLAIATFSIMTSGLFLQGSFYIPEGEQDTLGIDAVFQYDNINTSYLPVDVPVPGEVSDVRVSWQVYDSDGNLINEDSYYKSKVEKGKPVIINKETRFTRPVEDIGEVTAIIHIQGEVYHKNIEKEKEVQFNLQRLLPDNSYKWSTSE